MSFRRGSWFPARLDWMQVEVTSHCRAACLYCPRSVYRERWLDRHMSAGTFRSLSAALSKSRLVHLQGWGEPLAHPEFFDMVRTAKAAGCRVGMTTNGMSLDEQKCVRLVREGVDIVAFSLAGVDRANDRIRRGTSIEQVLDAIRTLGRARSLLRADNPDVHIAYMLLRSQSKEVQRLPLLLQGLNVKQAVISTLDFVAERALADEAISPVTDEDYAALRCHLEALVDAGRRSGLSIHCWVAAPGRGRPEEPKQPPTPMLGPFFLGLRSQTCTENIQRSAFVAADGEVSPCVYANIPAAGASAVVAGEERPYRRRTFGNINAAPFEAIWTSGAYAAFRAAHRRGRLPDYCLECPRSRMVAIA